MNNHKVLLISGHDNLNSSNANRYIIEQLKEQLGDRLEVRYLDQLYPDFNIDVEAEQQALSQAEYIIFQFPMYWYNMPALMKQWLDKTLTIGFAFGELPDGTIGDKLKGKKLLVSVTVGAPEEMHDGVQIPPAKVFYQDMEYSAKYCQMEFLEPLFSYDMFYMDEVYGPEKLAQVQANAREHVNTLVQRLKP